MITGRRDLSESLNACCTLTLVWKVSAAVSDSLYHHKKLASELQNPVSTCLQEHSASWIPHPHSRPPEGPWHRGYTTQDLATLRRRPFTSEEHSANFLKSVSPAPFLCLCAEAAAFFSRSRRRYLEDT
ncbi:hypothetical protein SAICODRAFT_204567 [Saitoella complicata NRRL Y-17804]|uniref:uncharacterized protein n=1 Tax=Saitoella complicata (strain BCRC 22490 / CBS 7301 / JCM 7358 / NBRC 10748 / NRRL Y-17804) TaxID=698492 RepID=UPI000867A506|nr:uncharacterized protein SAICODRAFT_204567 [Saitoella complicata NRRL Y-17804]ODQ54721.1 hypothetical protein SAICODRAFT_204567 [Saitoella complicata NRRL Y-17804]